MNRWIVLLMRSNGQVHKPVPFGPFDGPTEARDWAETGLDMMDDEYYLLTCLRTPMEY